MKLFKTLSMCLLLIVAGCDERSELIQEDLLAFYLEDFMESNTLGNLGVSPGNLNLEEAGVIRSPDGKSDILIIPLVRRSSAVAREPINNETSYVASYFTNRVSGISYRGTITNRSPEPFRTALEAGTFTGTITYDLGSGNTTTIEIQRGNPTTVTTRKCGIVEAGACAARTIDQMGPFSYITCVWEIPICFAILVADCLIAGCPWVV